MTAPTRPFLGSLRLSDALVLASAIIMVVLVVQGRAIITEGLALWLAVMALYVGKR